MPMSVASEWWSAVHASDQPDTALLCDVGPGPLGHHDKAAAEADQPEDVEKDPEQPGEKPRHIQAEDRADGGAAADGRHDAVVLVAERLERLARDGPPDVLAGARALLH